MTWASGPCQADAEPGVGLLPWGADAWALVVPAGSSASALAEAMAGMPAGLHFVEAYGDADVVLVYAAAGVRLSRRQIPGDFLRSMLELDPATVGDGAGRRWMTEGERDAYAAGKADVADALRRQVIRRRRPRSWNPAALG
ncbi:hypothetical protein [Parafrankia sp. BMG5.11]|uniref:hypothetical protein n=1 Tax=Parafrankia sp. BMG5.11 TaxID=222540 RepID=UPI001038BEB8|nr:hypothetical protein [Parafrankia sp. BMG5.11]TCJ40789.1 hypothetical protein E0504_03900 [Parafrankia sp. BMG5.11]